MREQKVSDWDPPRGLGDDVRNGTQNFLLEAKRNLPRGPLSSLWGLYVGQGTRSSLGRESRRFRTGTHAGVGDDIRNGPRIFCSKGKRNLAEDPSRLGGWIFVR